MNLIQQNSISITAVLRMQGNYLALNGGQHWPGGILII